MMTTEKQWRQENQINRMSLRQLVEAIPEGRWPLWNKLRQLQNKEEFLIKKIKVKQEILNQYDEDSVTHIIYSRWLAICEEAELSLAQKEIRRIQAVLYPKNEGDITDADIERARQFPITEIIKVNRSGFALCIWHNEKHASMYCRNNFCHCFVCQKTTDVIGLYMEINKCSFIEAVKYLRS